MHGEGAPVDEQNDQNQCERAPNNEQCRHGRHRTPPQLNFGSVLAHPSATMGRGPQGVDLPGL